VDRVYDAENWWHPRSNINRSRDGSQSSLERRHAGTVGLTSSSRRYGQQENGDGNLLEGSPWLERLRGELATVGSRTRQ
jgi:hypothetical protein